MERGMLPVGHAGNNNLSEVLEYPLEWLAIDGRFGWNLSRNLTGGDPGSHRKIADVFEIVGHPVDQLVSVLAKFGRIHS
jgi:hypothetical protein